MTKPWLKKNPYMSLWLSGANAFAGRQRSIFTAQLNRQVAEANRDAIKLWTDAALAWLPDRSRR